MPCKGCCNHLQKIAVLETTIFHLLKNSSLPPSQNARTASASNVSTKRTSPNAKLTLAPRDTANPILAPEKDLANTANQNASGPKQINKSIPNRLVIPETTIAPQRPKINSATGWPSLTTNLQCSAEANERPWANVIRGGPKSHGNRQQASANTSTNSKLQATSYKLQTTPFDANIEPWRKVNTRSPKQPAPIRLQNRYDPLRETHPEEKNGQMYRGFRESADLRP